MGWPRLLFCLLSTVRGRAALHGAATVGSADVISVLDGGRVAAHGTSDDGAGDPPFEHRRRA